MRSFPPSRPEEDPAGDLARMVAGLSYEALPLDVVDLAKKAILDTLAVTIAGSNWEVSPQIVAQIVEWGGTPEGSILIYGHKVPAPLAAFANGAMARAVDMGDVHESGGHVTEWNVPTMLAALRLAPGVVTGKDFITAYMAGAEVGVRTFSAANLIPNSNVGIPGEFQGIFCATASICRLLGLGDENTWNALGIGYSVHGLSEMQKHTEGVQMVRVQHSFTGDTAIKAALLARSGVTGPKGIYLGIPGGLLRHLEWDDIRPELLTDGLGRRWMYSEGLTLKPYSACKFTHSFIASTIELIRRHHLDWREIAAIDCVGSPGVTMVTDPVESKWRPNAAPEALFSAPYAIATAAITGDVFLDDFSEIELRRKDKQDLMRRISVKCDPAIENQFEGFPVTISMNDGRRFDHTEPFVKGHRNNPMTWDDLRAKFWKCTPYSAVSLPEAKLNRVIELCVHLEEVDDVNELIDNLTL